MIVKEIISGLIAIRSGYQWLVGPCVCEWNLLRETDGERFVYFFEDEYFRENSSTDLFKIAFIHRNS